MRLELAPDIFFALRAVGHPTNVTCLQSGIEPRKVGEFVRHRSDGTSQQCSKLDDLRIPHVDRSERNLIVEVERDDMFVAAPLLSVALGRYLQTGLAPLTLRAFPLPSICAVAAIDVIAPPASHHPNLGVVVGSAVIGRAEKPLTVAIVFPGIHRARLGYQDRCNWQYIALRRAG